MKEEGLENDLLDRIAGDPLFQMSRKDLEGIMQPKNFVGRAPQQVDEFLESYVSPILEENKAILGQSVEINV